MLATATDLKTLFLEHLAARRAAAEEALRRTGYEALVISSGEPFTYFADDQDAPFRPVPHFAHWCPLQGPHHVLKVVPGRKPLLIRYAPEDFWYEQLPLQELWHGDPFWAEGFDLVEVGTVDAVWAALGHVDKAAYLGCELDRAKNAGLDPNPKVLTAHLDWTRSFKTPYEVHCLSEAQKLGAKGHRAAREAFLAGASELEIHQAYVQAVGCVDADLPYNTIVALNEKGAILHYEHKRIAPKKGAVLLLDAGAKVLGYGSDITRTWTAPHCDERFTQLVDDMGQVQKELCEAVRPGMPYGELHDLAHRKIGGILLAHGILKADLEEAVKEGLTRAFFPHGLGHHLGLQVHDVAGKQADPEGHPAPPPSEHPYLRTTRMIEAGQVFTVEPGLYFIPMLLRPFRHGGAREAFENRFDWQLIDALTPMGGIRIEDNLLVTESGSRNLTREYLPE